MQQARVSRVSPSRVSGSSPPRSSPTPARVLVGPGGPARNATTSGIYGSATLPRPATGVSSPIVSGPAPMSARTPQTVKAAVKNATFSETILYLTMKQTRGVVKRKPLYFRAVHNNKGYWVGKTHHLYYDGDKFVVSKLAPNSGSDPHIIAICNNPSQSAHVPPADGWSSEKYDCEVSVASEKPRDWVEGERSEGRERVSKLLAALKKTEKDGEFSLKVKDICRNIEAVKEFLPELLCEFPRIDADGNGAVSLEELDNYFDAGKKKDHSKEKLDEFWKQLTSNRKDSKNILGLEDMAAQLEFIEEKLPELLECFQDIDTHKTCSIDRGEFDAFFGSVDVWLESKLQDIIGLVPLKEQIKQFYFQQKLDRMRRRGGKMINNDEAIVIMFKGSPGTGKTTIGRLLAGLLYKIGVTPTDSFFEVQRDELVGDHIGATEKQTSAKIEEAKGGVLFVDEAYRLRSDSFGVEAINCLMKAMTVKGTVMILAGYPKQMEEFVSANPGLARRITYEMEFPDYSSPELAMILKTQIEKRGFQLANDATLDFMSEAIQQSTDEKQRTCFNGGIGEHITRHSIFNLNKREIEKVQAENDPKYVPSITLLPEDIRFGCTKIPQPPPEDLTWDFQKDSKVRVKS